jgi:hypothetical protein
VALLMLAIGSIAGMAVGSRAQAETQYTPSVSLAEQYNSNVWYTAPNRIPPGKQVGDLITTVGANVIILNKSRLGDTEVRAGVDGNVYAYNTDLSYASTAVRATSDMSNWAHELLPGLKLRISDAFRYTPNQAAFPISGVTSQPSDIFTQGIQPARANTWSNNLSTDGDYAFSRSTGLRANYTFSMLRIGRVYVTQAAPSGALNYFDTTTHNVAIGPTYTFDGGDTLFLKYSYLTSNQLSTTSGSTIHFTSQTIQPEYVTRIARDWIAGISGGGTIVEQAGNRTFFSGSFSLTNAFDRQTQVSISVARQTAPAYFGTTGGAFISNVAQLSVSHDFSELTRLFVRGNYAKGQSVPVNVSEFETITGSAVLDYKMTRDTKLSLSQTYLHSNVTGATPFAFDQFITMLMVSMEWK